MFTPTPDTLMLAAAVTLTFPPAASLAPLVIMLPATLIVPAPALVIFTSPEAVPAAAVVVMSCPAARSTPPVPPVSVTAPPAVVMPAFKSNVVPCKVTSVVAPVAVINPSTCTSPPVPLERITTESRKVEVSTVINPVCAACPILMEVAPSLMARRSLSFSCRVPAPPPTPIVVAAVAPCKRTSPVDVMESAPPLKSIALDVTVRSATIAPSKSTVPPVPPIRVRFCPPKALTRVRSAPAATAPLLVVSMVVAAVRVITPRATTPPAVRRIPAPDPEPGAVAVTPPTKSVASVAEDPIVKAPVF